MTATIFTLFKAKTKESTKEVAAEGRHFCMLALNNVNIVELTRILVLHVGYGRSEHVALDIMFIGNVHRKIYFAVNHRAVSPQKYGDAVTAPLDESASTFVVFIGWRPRQSMGIPATCSAKNSGRDQITRCGFEKGGSWANS